MEEQLISKDSALANMQKYSPEFSPVLQAKTSPNNHNPPRNFAVTPTVHPHQLVKKDNSAVRKLLWATVFATIFMFGEFVAGYYANSLAIMTDAAHLLADIASFMLSLLAIWFSRRFVWQNQ
jgi:hypothetical protein